MTEKTAETCGCCQGVKKQTPANVANRSGLSSLSYRAGTHSNFKKSMIAALSDKKSLPEGCTLLNLTTRADDDFSIALLDAWGTVGDVLTFYQERIANEGFLRTAAERGSILELARSVGYELRPGVAASTNLAFKIEDAPGAVDSTTIDVGTKAQSLPIQGRTPPEVPQTFETIEKIVAYPELNNLKPKLMQQQPINKDNVESLGTIVFKGTDTKLVVGDGLLIVLPATNDQVQLSFKIVTLVQPDNVSQRTLVTVRGESLNTQYAAAVPPDDPPSAIYKESAPVFESQVNVENLDKMLAEEKTIAKLSAFISEHGWVARNFARAAKYITRSRPPETTVKVYALRIHARFFGHNAQPYNTTPWKALAAQGLPATGLPPNPYPTSWEDCKINTYSTGTPYGDGTSVYLDNVYSQVQPDGWIVIKDNTAAGAKASAYRITKVFENSVADFMMSAKATGLSLDVSGSLDANGSPIELSQFKMRETAAFIQSEELKIGDVPDTTTVTDTSIVLDSLILEGLMVDKPICITGELSNQPGNVTSEVVSITSVVLSENGHFTKVSFTHPVNSYVPQTISINANVAAATHGETKTEVLGSGDPSNTHLESALRQKPLTYVAAATPQGATSTLELRVDDILWNEVGSLYGIGPKDHSYVTRLEDDGQTRILFGDARPNVGVENITAKYRVGIGSEGIVKAGQLSLLVTRPLGVRSVTNPENSKDAADPETRDQARKNAPLRVLTLDRIVSVKDCENFALTFAAIGKAKALMVTRGELKWVRLIVGGKDGNPIKFEPKTIGAALSEAIKNYGDPLMKVRLESFDKKLFSIEGTVWVEHDRIPSLVEQAIVKALQAEFSFDKRQFGQGVVRSEVVAVIQRVDGVVGVDLDYLYPSVEDKSDNDYLACEDSSLLLLNPDPSGVTLEVTPA